MAIQQGQLKVKNGENFDVLHNETSADVVKYSDTTVAAVLGGLNSIYVAKDGDKVLSTNDFTNAYKTAIDNLDSTYVEKVAGKDLSTNDFTDAYKTAIDGLETTYAKKSDIADVFHYRGTVANFSAIPSDTAVGDVWNIAADGGTDENGIAIMAGDNVAKTKTGFDVLAGTADLSGYVQKDGDKVLSTNDFTDEYKAAIDGLSAVDPADFLQVYVGNTAPSSANVIWFDTTDYE